MRATFLLSALLLLSFGALSSRAQPAGKSHLDFRNEARIAYEKKDYPAARAAAAEALKLRPDSPRYLHNLAALSALTSDAPAALDYLRRLAALGVATPVERDPDLASLHGTPEYLRVLAQLSANREPRGAASLLAELPGRTGIIEGIAVRERTGDIFLGDVHQRCIWRRSREGDLTRFTPEAEDIAGIFGLALDETRQTLWATMCAVPEMEGFTPDMKGYAALAEFDLRTGELRHVIDVPDDGRDHLLGDLLVGPDGTLYATDSRAPVVWQFTPGGEEPQKLIDTPLVTSLQGLVLKDRILIVSDYSNGLLALDLRTRQLTPLTPPENTTLLGLDGLVGIPGGLVAIQNGTTPQRVLRIMLSPESDRITDVHVLASGLPELTDLSLVTLAQDRPTFVAGSGWDVFEAARGRPAAPHPVRIFQVDPAGP